MSMQSYSRLMPPPSLPMSPPSFPPGALFLSEQSAFSHWEFTAYPRVNTPSSWPSSNSFAPPPSSSWNRSAGHRSDGYSEAHQHYASQREAWAKKAYQSNLGETIGIIMQVLREVPGKPKGQLVQVSYRCSPSFYVQNLTISLSES